MFLPLTVRTQDGGGGGAHITQLVTAATGIPMVELGDLPVYLTVRPSGVLG